MILFDPIPIVPKPLRNRFRVLRTALILVFIGAGTVFGYRMIFPSQHFLFSFENPNASSNSLEIPKTRDGTEARKGNFPKDSTFVTYAGTVGMFSSIRVELTLEKDSPRPDRNPEISVRKSYRSFFYPEGEPIVAATKDRGFVVDKTAYFFSDGTLRPFLSDRAALSWFPKEDILPANEDLLRIFPPKEDLEGFRPGTLLSDMEGVYAIDGSGRARPIGSTAIFESLGFDWDSVVPADEEEIRFHERGKIMLFDAPQPDGTFFSDTKTKRYFLIENGKRRPIVHDDSLASLHAVSKPIAASEDALDRYASCTLRRTVFSLRRTYFCDMPIETLRDLPGGSFEISVSVPETIRAATLQATFSTSPNRTNFSLFANQIRERFKTVYGDR
ncbi:MAG: hypothetical protein KBD19_00340 [Candidatus Moranbacteria bacterium]|nr:hypothetical protein [Candidatus Moranbacteria bacterium]